MKRKYKLAQLCLGLLTLNLLFVANINYVVGQVKKKLPSPTPTPIIKPLKAKETSIDDNQPKCQNASKIKLQGFSIGMSVDEVLQQLQVTRSKIAPLFITSKNSLGEEVKVEVGNSKLEYLDSKDIFRGVISTDFKFYEGKVYEIFVMYDGNIKWNDIEDYAETFGKALNLPEGWIFRESKGSLFERFEYAWYGNFCSSETIRLSLYLKEGQKSNLYNGVHPITKERMYYEEASILTNTIVEDEINNKAKEVIERQEQQQKNEIERKKKVFKP